LTAAVVTGLLGAAVPLAAGAVLSNAAYPSQWGRWYSSYYQPGRPSYHWPDGSSRAEPPPAVPHYFHELGWNTSWQEFGQDYVTAFAAACAWPWVTLLTLMIFRASMRRAKVRPGHVRRCVLYSADVFLWAGLYVFALTAIAMMSWMSSGTTRMHHHLAIASLPIGWGLATHRLGRAYSQYLRFDRPWATVIASQVIVALLALLLLLHFALDRMIHEWRIL
jgi:hypothetical protein